MIPKIIHFTIPSKPSEQQLKNIQKAKEINPDFKIIVWQDPLRPTDFLLGRYFNRVNSGAQLADLIRLEVVERHGGVYLDSDMECISSLGSLTDYSEFCCASENGLRLTNAAFAAPVKHPATRDLIEYLLKNEPDWTLPPHITTGPEFFSNILKSRSDVRILSRVLFYPFNWNESTTPPHPLTLATHLWTTSWKTPSQKRNDIKPYTTLKSRVKRIAKPLVRRLKTQLEKIVAEAIRNDRPPSYPRTDVVVTQLSGDITIFLDGTDISITPELLLRGSYERVEERFVENALHGGDWFVDVGANVGIFSLIAAKKVGPFGRVWSFEPNKSLHPLIRRSLIANWFQDRVKVEPFALSDKSGVATLEIPNEVLGGAHLSGKPIHSTLTSNRGAEQSAEVEVRTLDSFFDELAAIRVLKIDVEGNEAKVLKGGKRLFERKQVDFILIEVIDVGDKQSYDDTIEELNNLVASGYIPGFLNEASAFVVCKSLAESLRIRNSRNLVLASPTTF